MILEKKYVKAKTAEEAVRIAHEMGDDFSFIAGGTDVMLNKFQGNNCSSSLIDISGIGEMKQVVRNDKYLKIGTGLSLEDIMKHSEINMLFPILGEAAHAVGSPVIRKTATIGGNLLCENRCMFYNQSEWWREAVGYCLKCEGDICIATGGKKNCFSKFVSDMAIALISIDATIEVLEFDGSYMTSLEEIYTGDGINPKKIKKNSIIKAIHIPIDEGFRSVFKKLRQRESMDFGSVTTAVSINKSGRTKILIGCVDPKPIVVEGNISESKTEMIAKAVKKARIVDNDVYTREYRKEMITVLLKRSFKELE